MVAALTLSASCTSIQEKANERLPHSGQSCHGSLRCHQDAWYSCPNVIYPDENHWVLKPQNGILWQRTFFSWLDKWLKE